MNPARRRRISPQAQQWIVAPGGEVGHLDWRDVFGADRPVELDVGCGKGLFLLTAARADPDTNFLGIELAAKYALLAASRLAKRAVANARVMRTDARALLTLYLPEASVRRIHVLFPDPWWKKRHRKRRVFNAAFIAQCHRVLEPGGDVHVATDVESYFGDIQELFAADGRFQACEIPLPADPSHDMDYLTNYERRSRKAGRPVYRVRYVRTDRI